MKADRKFKLIQYFVLILALSFVFTCKSSPQVNYAHLGIPDERIPLTENAITGYLPNGLRYFILENRFPENRAHLSLVVNAGSVLEREDERGIAHFVEHMAFNGTERFPGTSVMDYLRTLGMRMGAEINAYTYYNETVYYFDLPVEIIDGEKRISDTALSILDQWSHAVTFEPEYVDSERLVIIEEYRARSRARERVQQITMPILFAGSAYENRSPIGTLPVLENVTQQQLKDFYQRWYTSDNMAIVIVGDFDGKALEADLARHFNISAPASSINRPVYNLPPPRNGNFHVEIITDPELTQTGIEIYFKQKPLSQRGTLADYRQSILNNLVIMMLRQRFDEAALNPDAAAGRSWGGIWNFASASQFFVMGTQPKTGRAEDALRELLLEKESMRRFGFTSAELERAKLNLVSYMERQVSERDRRESEAFAEDFIYHYLFGYSMPDIEWEADAVLTLLPGIGLNEITRHAGNYFSANDCIIFITAPQAEADSLPSQNRVRALFRETQRARLTARQSEAVSGDLLERLPVSGNIASETADSGTGAVILTLGNGARIILQKTANRNNEIIMYAMAKGGTDAVSLEYLVSASLAAEMLNVSGLGPYSRTELQYRLAGKQVSSSFWVSHNYRGFQGSSTTADIKTLFEMIYLFFTDVRLDERAVTAMIDRYRTSLALQSEDPQRFFMNELTKIINNNNPRFMPLEYEDMDSVSIEKALAFLNMCINPADYTFVFTGNINMEQIKELSARYIASIPASPSLNSWTNHSDFIPSDINTVLHKGQDERSFVYLGWFAPNNGVFSEEAGMISSVLSEYLDIVMSDEIREKLGGVYSIGSYSNISVIPRGLSQIYFFFLCNPARADELIEAVKRQLILILTEPLNTDIFNKAKEALLMQHENNMQQNQHIAQSYANSFVLYQTPLNRLHNRPDVIRAVSLQDVQAFARQVLYSNPVQIVMYPENR